MNGSMNDELKEQTLSQEASGSNNLANFEGERWPFWCGCWWLTDLPSFIVEDEAMNKNQNNE